MKFIKPGHGPKERQMEKLNLDNLRKIDQGLIVAAFDAELAALVKDCDERPLEDKPRELTLKLKLTPDPQGSAGGVYLDKVNVEFELVGKRPVSRTRVYTMTAKHDHTLAFQPESPDDPDQGTIAEELRRKRGEQ